MNNIIDKNSEKQEFICFIPPVRTAGRGGDDAGDACRSGDLRNPVLYGAMHSEVCAESITPVVAQTLESSSTALIYIL